MQPRVALAAHMVAEEGAILMQLPTSHQALRAQRNRTLIERHALRRSEHRPVSALLTHLVLVEGAALVIYHATSRPVIQ